MDWIILADLIVMKEFLEIQAMSIMIITQEHLGLNYSHTEYFLQQHLLPLNI